MISALEPFPLFRQASKNYTNALAAGTMRNKHGQVKVYFAFMLAYGFEPFSPTYGQLLMYLQLLRNSLRTIQAVRNYLSGVKTYLEERGVDISPFRSILLINLVRAFVRMEGPGEHRVMVKIKPQHINKACLWLRNSSPTGEIIAGTIIFSFVTMLRQCHSLFTPCGYHHLIPQKDLIIDYDKIIVYVRSSKTTSGAAIRPILIMASRTILCPVTLINRAISLVPAPLEAPVFLDPRTGAAFSPDTVLIAFRTALQATGFKEWAGFTLHCLRHAGVHACTKEGVPISRIQEHGGWRSSAIKAYLPKEPDTLVPTTIRDLLIQDIH